MDDLQTARPGILRRIIAFPLTLMVLEFLAVAMAASAATVGLKGLFSHGTPGYFLGGLAWLFWQYWSTSLALAGSSGGRPTIFRLRP